MPQTDDRQVLVEYLVKGGIPAVVSPDAGTGVRSLSLDLSNAVGGGDLSITVFYRVERLADSRISPAARP